MLLKKLSWEMHEPLSNTGIYNVSSPSIQDKNKKKTNHILLVIKNIKK